MAARKVKQVSSTDKALLVQALPYMVLAKDAYTAGVMQGPNGWRVVAASGDRGRQRVEGFFGRIYEKPDAAGNPQYVVVFRGTDQMNDVLNLKADLRIAFMKHTDQHEKGLKFVQDFCRAKNINPADLAFTGHSLGGYLAATVGKTFGSQNIWTFEAPAPDAAVWRKMEDCKTAHQIQATPARPGPGWVQVRSSADIISKWGHYEGARVITLDTIAPPHGLDELRYAAQQTINGEQMIGPDPAPPPRGFLSRAFNAVTNVAQKLAVSPTVDRIIAAVMSFDPGRPWQFRIPPPGPRPGFG